ncbi:MAG: hypothetical protein ABSF34_13270 [Verrucomicrobiota bacterium]
MAKSQFDVARGKTREFVRINNVEDHMFHGPVSDQYWAEPFRVIVINMESYGYKDHNEVDRNMLIEWLYDAGHKRTRTTRYTLALLALVLERVTQGSHPSRESIAAAYRNKCLLEQTLDRTVYYNIRSKSNENKKEDFAAIVAMGPSDIGVLIWAEILALDPHVLIISGNAGLVALNVLAKLKPTLHLRQQVSWNGVLIQSIAHPSRPNYAAWCSAIDGIGNACKNF